MSTIPDFPPSVGSRGCWDICGTEPGIRMRLAFVFRYVYQRLAQSPDDLSRNWVGPCRRCGCPAHTLCMPRRQLFCFKGFRTHFVYRCLWGFGLPRPPPGSQSMQRAYPIPFTFLSSAERCIAAPHAIHPAFPASLSGLAPVAFFVCGFSAQRYPRTLLLGASLLDTTFITCPYAGRSPRVLTVIPL